MKVSPSSLSSQSVSSNYNYKSKSRMVAIKEESEANFLTVNQGLMSPSSSKRRLRDRNSLPSKMHAQKHYTAEELIESQYQLLLGMVETVAQRPRKNTLAVIDRHGHFKESLKNPTGMVVEEISEVVDVQPHGHHEDDSTATSPSFSNAQIPVSGTVKKQLRLFVERIAASYHNDNPFHCFEHACHVTFSVYNLMRQAAVKDLPPSPTSFPNPWSAPFTSLSNDLDPNDTSALNSASKTLARDPLAQFAVVFSAMIHDVDHRGVPNTQLAKERPSVAAKYQHRSLAEQTSIDVAWDILEEPAFDELKACLFATRQDFIRFRSMVINVVMATDSFDASLRAFREQKWNKALQEPSSDQEQKEDVKRKVSVMMDLIMMSSDISHTMQSFEVYCQWNERLYREMYLAYQEGRSLDNEDPSLRWYFGELVFYDKHIIPLARRLQESKLFGAAATHLLAHAMNNRRQWEKDGAQISQDMIERLQKELGDHHETAATVSSEDDQESLVSERPSKKAKIVSSQSA